MFLSNASVRRPIAMSCLIIALALLGLNSLRKLGLELMPKVDVPYVTITTVYPGASPQEIETDIAKRIEDAVGTIDGLKHITSSCMENVCQTQLEFHLGVDVDIAATDVREKLDLIRTDLPENAEDPKVLKFDVNATPVVTLALAGSVPLEDLYDYADNALRDRLTVLSGVADVQLVGGAQREVHVTLNRRKLAARGLAGTDVVGAIRRAVGTIPAGRVREEGTEYTVKFDADCREVSELADLEIIGNDGRRCYVRDMADVAMTTEEVRQKATLDGEPAVAIRVVKKADANPVAVAERVRGAMGTLNARMPGGMRLVWVNDSGTFIRETNSSAWINVFQGVLLTAVILFLFLYNLRSLVVVAVTMPLTILIGLFFMDLVGFSLNTPTLLSIGMSVGILVTNSIVVLEAIVKRLDRTGDPKEAARIGAAEAWLAVLASAGTNIVVLFPLAMMHSMVGEFIRPFSLTMVIMTAVSLFISFTLTPLLCSVLLKAKAPNARGPLARLERGWNRGLAWVIEGYRRILQFNERHRASAIGVLLLVGAMLVHALMLAGSLGSGMVNEPDRGVITVKLEFPTRYDLDRTDRRVREIQQRLKDLPELEHMLSSIGKVDGMIGKSSEGVYLAQIMLTFSQRDAREVTIHELQRKIRRRLAGLPGVVSSVTMPNFGGGQNYDIEMEIAGADFDTLDRVALRARELAEENPGMLDPDTTVRVGKPELRIHPRRAVLSDLNQTATGLGMDLRTNLEGTTAGTYKRGARTYDIVVKLAEEPGRDQVLAFQFPAAPGRPAVLENLADLAESRAPVQITRRDKSRVSKLLAVLDAKTPLGSGVEQITRAVRDDDCLPAGYELNFAGMYEMMREGQAGLGEAGLIAIVLVILTLAAILESFKQPLLILVTLPLALIGMIWALAIAGSSLGIFEIMGAVMMVGIVVNNAILIMDQFNVHVREEGIPRHKAMVTAACERFRPIVMITLAAVLGMCPLAFGTGIGAEMRNGVGLASVGGIFVSGVLTLVVLPILYDLFTRRSRPQP